MSSINTVHGMACSKGVCCYGMGLACTVNHVPNILVAGSYYISNNTGDWWGVSPEQLKLINQFYLDSVKNKRLRECNGMLSILTSDGLWRKVLCIPKSSQHI